MNVRTVRVGSIFCQCFWECWCQLAWVVRDKWLLSGWLLLLSPRRRMLCHEVDLSGICLFCLSVGRITAKVISRFCCKLVIVIGSTNWKNWLTFDCHRYVFWITFQLLSPLWNLGGLLTFYLFIYSWQFVECTMSRMSNQSCSHTIVSYTVTCRFSRRSKMAEVDRSFTFDAHNPYK